MYLGSHCLWFQASAEGLGMYLPWIRRDYCIAVTEVVKWYLVVALIYISLKIKDAQHLFSVLIDYMSIFGELSIQIFDPLCNWVIYLFIIEL